MLRGAAAEGADDAAKAHHLQHDLPVVSGSGRSTVGEHTFDWSQNDVFSIPHWSFASHMAKDGDASLFIVSDKSAFENLDLLREELQ